MKDRCYNSKNNRFSYYGEKGITVCKEWVNDFTAFYTWAYKNGYKDNLSLDRKDFNKGYEPSNCKWSTLKEQANNKSSNHLVTINGITKTLAQWSDISGILAATILNRIKLGWSTYELLLPVQRKNHKLSFINHLEAI